MKINVFVNFEERRVLTEAEFNELKTERAKDYAEGDGAFRDWLNDNYEAFVIFNMKSHELEQVAEGWKGVCRKDAEEDLSFEYAEYCLDV